MHRFRRLVILGLTAAVIALPASPASAAQVFAQYDALTTHIYQVEVGGPSGDRTVRRPAHVKLRIADPSRELTDDEVRDLVAGVPDPLNDLCSDSSRDVDEGSGDGAKVNECPVREMEVALEQRVSGLLVQMPDFDFGEVSAHIALRRDDNRPMQMLPPVLLGLGLLSLLRRRGGTGGAPRVTGWLHGAEHRKGSRAG